MLKLTLRSASVRIAAFPEGGRLLTVLAACVGPSAACASARLIPRRHALAPEDGLWDIDMISNPEGLEEGVATWRELVFTGEADWCEGVRIHGPGGMLECRIDSPTQAGAVRPTAPLATLATDAGQTPPWGRRRFSRFSLTMDVLAAVLIIAGLALLPLSAPSTSTAPLSSGNGVAATVEYADLGR
jgi:hypothetical protein